MTGNEWALILTALAIGLALGAESATRTLRRRRRLTESLLLAKWRADDAAATRRDDAEWAAIRAATEHSIDIAMWEQECDADS